jgi:hypothetical protein
MPVGTGEREACLGWKPRLTRARPSSEWRRAARGRAPNSISSLLGGDASGSMSVEWPSSAVVRLRLAGDHGRDPPPHRTGHLAPTPTRRERELCAKIPLAMPPSWMQSSVMARRRRSCVSLIWSWDRELVPWLVSHLQHGDAGRSLRGDVAAPALQVSGVCVCVAPHDFFFLKFHRMTLLAGAFPSC